jgi:hypothetical protein
MGYVSRAGAVPANLPVGRDLTIRRKIENGRYYCVLGARIESGHHVALVTSGLNLTENRRFEFAVAEAAGAVD